MHILIPVISLGAIGLVLGLLLAVASKYLSVEQDERIPLITEALPGANCGGCGFAGCSAFANAVVEGKAQITGCPVGGTKCSEELAKIMNVELAPVSENVAMVFCRGVNEAAKKKYIYEGFSDCEIANRLAGGDKVCNYGCIGFGNCVKVCQFGAMTVVDGVAIVDPEKCTACGMCLAACPKSIIRLIPKDKEYSVRCTSQDKGNKMKDICSAGCIACRLCEKACPTGAIEVVSNIAKIDYSKCTDCGECFKKCPKKIIYKYPPDKK